MKIPLHWLREYVDSPLPVPELVERLTLAGLEASGVRSFGLPLPPGLALKAADESPVWGRDTVRTAEVLSVAKHPNAEKLKLVTLEYGAAEPKVVVTGAPNVAVGDVGQKVIVGLTGTVYRDTHATPVVLKTLAPTTLRGVPSDAMVMSNAELGIADDHDGIIILEADAPVGVPLADFMGDLVIEVDVLPNMARCLSMLGVAREVAALTGRPVRVPRSDVRPSGKPIAGRVTVATADPHLCARYMALLIEGVTDGPSPGWMQRRLRYAGMRPISLLVDVTNYVMLEHGQPLHAFDYDVLVKRANGGVPAITARPAKAGEVLKTLDGVERKLTPDQLVIADAAGPIALAGVMGGAETEVGPATKNVLLESASFDFVSVRKTARALDLHSEASTRFSKGVHPELVPVAAARAAFLLQELAGGAVADGAADVYPSPLPPQVVELPLAEVRRVLGVDVPADEAERVLTALEFRVEKVAADRLRVTVPPFRLDVQAGAADLIEELARVRGYDRLPPTLLADPLPEQRGNPALAAEERVRDLLAVAGLQECVTYSLTTPERESLLTGESAAEYVRLLNPVSAERSVMRRVLLPGLLDVAQRNLEHAPSVRLFELGPVYLPRAGERLPDEPRRLALVLCGRRDPAYWTDAPGTTPAALDFFDLKGVVEGLLADLHAPAAEYRPAKASWLHPGRSADVVVGGMTVGVIGNLHPRTAKAFGLGGREVIVGELDVPALLAAVPTRYAVTHPPRFPAALRDLAVIVGEEVPADRVLAEVRTAGGPLLRSAALFDVYRGPSVPTGTKSLAYALSYQADDRTLKVAEIDAAHQGVEAHLRSALGAQVRGRDGA